MSNTRNMLRLLITGGAGFIGSNFVRWILHGHPNVHITIIDKLTYAGRRENLFGVPEKHIDFIHGDVCDLKTLSVLVPGNDAVIHFAAESHNDWSIVDPATFFHTNVEGTRCVCKACAAHGVRLHHVSTDEVFGTLSLGDSARFNESSLYAPTTPYASSKALSDEVVREFLAKGDLEATISNCSNNYGPYQHIEKFIPRQVTNVLSGLRPKLYGDGKNVRDWIHVEDHCSAIWTILTEGSIGETYVVGSDGERSNIDVLRAILECMGRASDDFDWVRDRPGHDRRYAIDPTKLRTELGWSPRHTDFMEGLEETIAWYRDNEAWWRPVKEATEAKYAARGQ